MNASSMKARVVELVQVIGVSLLAGCGGGGGGDEGNQDGSGAGANRPPPATSTRRPFQLRHAISVVEYAGCARGLDKVGSLPIGFADAGVFAACIEADTVVTVDGQRFDAASIPDGSVAIVSGLRTVTNDGRRTSVATAIDLQRTVVGTIESVDWAHARLYGPGSADLRFGYHKDLRRRDDRCARDRRPCRGERFFFSQRATWSQRRSRRHARPGILVARHSAHRRTRRA